MIACCHVIVPGNLSAQQWKQSDGPYGVVSNSAAYLTCDANGTIIAGTTGGMYRLDNGESTWARIDTFSGEVVAVAARGSTIIASIDYGKTLVSIDGGTTWRSVTAPAAQTVFMSSSGDAYSGGRYNEFQLNRSTDGGVTWHVVDGPAGESSPIHSISETRDGDLLVGTAYRIHKLPRGSTTWRQLSSNQQLVYALGCDSTGVLLAGSLTVGLRRSTDDGATWIETSLGIVPIYRIVVGPGDRIYATTKEGFFYSVDHGETWQKTGWPGAGINGLAVNAGGSVFIGAGAGIMVSTDGGSSWARTIHGISNVDAKPLSIAGSDIYASVNWNRQIRSTDDGRSWSDVGDSAYLNIAPVPDGSLLGITYSALSRSTDRGLTWRVVPSLVVESSRPLSQLLTTPNGTIFVVGEGEIRRSTDNGETWEPRDVFPRSDEETWARLVLDDAGMLFAAVIYGGVTAGNRIQRSSDNGNSWTTLENSPTRITGLAINRNGDIVTIYQDEIYGWRADEDDILRSTDHGDTWQRTMSGLPTRITPNDISADTVGNFYLAAEEGILRLRSGRSIWEMMPRDGLIGSRAHVIGVTPGGALLVGITANGLFRYGEVTASTGPEAHDRGAGEGATLLAGYERDAVMIHYSVGRHLDIELAVFDLFGREVEVLARGYDQPGEHRTRWSTQGVLSGVYLIRLRHGTTTLARKVIVVR